jgi:hypothetical protein
VKTHMKMLLHLSVCLVIIALVLGGGCSDIGKPKLVLDDATHIFDFSMELPTDFSGGAAAGEAAISDLLGVGSVPIYFQQGVVLEEWPWCQIQCILWVVDEEVAEQVSVEEALSEYGLGDSLESRYVNLGESVEAILYGGDCSGLDFLMLKYGRVYILINSWYSHPRDECISLVDLGEVVVERLKEYSQ